MTYQKIDHQIGMLTKAPVVYNMVMLRFPLEQNIGQFVAEITSALKSNYVRAEDRPMQSLKVSYGKDGQSLQTKNTVEYVFNTPDRSLGFTLKEDVLFIHCTKYPGFLEFSQAVREIFEVVAEFAGLSYYTALGIRYVDAVVPQDEAPMCSYVKDFLATPRFDSLGIEPFSEHASFFFQTDLGRLSLRTYKLRNDMCVPPDLQDTAQLLSPKGGSWTIEPEFMVIDTDHIYESKEAHKFELDDLLARLDAMHTYTTSVFKDAVKEEAVSEWR